LRYTSHERSVCRQDRWIKEEQRSRCDRGIAQELAH
jgi:hypothetical protein